ncbi:MAG: NADP-dependent malic enzyme [Ignavibacteria bacterium]|nr:MAG: NADP-dependent malic enzyme [Ignavibacteria bacterium]
MAVTREEALEYHRKGRKGKIEVRSTKPFFTSRDLSLAYTPGVAEPCREIHKNPHDAYQYTAKGNLVAVVSNGSAVLGLGNIGPLAGKPVMEGKGVLFKRFADIDVFDIELNTADPDELIKAVKLMEPTFGGINLEDIKAPECFYIEKKLQEIMNIPVFHDDQHGTAIISCAALLNAAELAGKKLEDMKVVVSGAGAAAMACTKLYIHAGIKKENVVMFDSKGCIHKDREDLNEYKAEFAVDECFPSIADALDGADLFVGVSAGGLLTPEMIKKMNDNPIVFALANPDPEIDYPTAVSARDDIIMATGRSDYPNQVNNVLGFPFIFRGALDVKATKINEEMKMAAVHALADLAKEKVPDSVRNAYDGIEINYGREYIIPKPFDPRVLWKVAPAVAKAAVDSGVARKEIQDWEAYGEELKERLGYTAHNIRVMISKAKKSPKKVLYPDGFDERIIRAGEAIVTGNIGTPVLLGNVEKVTNRIKELGFDPSMYEIIDPRTDSRLEKFAEIYFEKRSRHGIARSSAKDIISRPTYFGSMMLHTGEVDALIGGLNSNYNDTIRPALEIIGVKKGFTKVAGLYMIMINRKVLFFADTTVNVRPTSEELAELAILTADTVRDFDVEPRIAMLSFSNFGSVRHPESEKVKKAVEIVNQRRPELIIDGEMQADTALQPALIEKEYPFSKIKGNANVMIFPDLNSGNITYKLFERLTDATVIGPILMGMNKSVHIVQRAASVEDIINITAIAVVRAK